MPKSRNRKDHKKKSKARSERIRNQQLKLRDELIKKMKAEQEAELLKNSGDNTETNNNVVENDEIDLNLDLENLEND